MGGTTLIIISTGKNHRGNEIKSEKTGRAAMVIQQCQRPLQQENLRKGPESWGQRVKNSYTISLFITYKLSLLPNGFWNSAHWNSQALGVYLDYFCISVPSVVFSKCSLWFEHNHLCLRGRSASTFWCPFPRMRKADRAVACTFSLARQSVNSILCG